MRARVIEMTGVVISMNEEGSYALDVWARVFGDPSATHTYYDRLSWNEAGDVIASELHSHRPGWLVGDGWSQPPLFP